jgi:catechol 2,3-dioxygenase-like lactoylglutathione lyase family enzyme
MPVLDLHHVAIKTLDLEATNRFYIEVLGMKEVARPPFDFPGSWLNIGATMIHVFAGYAALDRDGAFHPGAAAIDHLSLQAQDFEGFKRIFRDRGLKWRELDQPVAKLWQLFVHDPSGILIELNFPIDREPPGATGPDPANPYLPGQF